jgi:hypothetical protein
MKRSLILTTLVLSLVLTGCATSYQSDSITGGYSEREVSPNVWRLRYGGNAYTTRETVQTYWLYRAAEFTIEQGFDGFEILAPANRSYSGTGSELPVPMYVGAMNKPALTANIRLLKKPFTAHPPIVFDAKALKLAVEPHVKGPLCDDNVCPHVHLYLMPES